MTEHRLQELLGQLDAPGALRSAEQAQQDDARHMGALARRIGGVPRRSRVALLTRGAMIGTIGLLGALAAIWVVAPPAAPLAGLGTTSRVRTVEGQIWVHRGGDSFVASVGDALAVGDQVELAPGASGTLEVAHRTEVRLSGGAALELAELGANRERVHLQSGRGRFQVGLPKRALFVESPHLVVEVTGTQFTVAVESQRSCVFVHSGRVIATARGTQRHATLESDQAFSSDGETCASLPVVEWVEARSDDSPPRETAASPSPSAATSPSAAHRPQLEALQSTLRKENRLLLSAIAARREGRLREARQSLEQLLGRYPNTPLRAAAEEELERVAKAERTQPADTEH